MFRRTPAHLSVPQDTLNVIENAALRPVKFKPAPGLFCRSLPYQQNLQRLLFTIFVLRAKDNTRETLRLLIPKIFERLAKGDLQNFVEID